MLRVHSVILGSPNTYLDQGREQYRGGHRMNISLIQIWARFKVQPRLRLVVFYDVILSLRPRARQNARRTSSALDNAQPVLNIQ